MKAVVETAGGLLLLAGVGVAKFGMPEPVRALIGTEPAPAQVSSNPWTIGAPDLSGIRQPADSNTYFRNCDAARAAGAAPLRSGEPGYRPSLDRDGDGIACEPYRGR